MASECSPLWQLNTEMQRQTKTHFSMAGESTVIVYGKEKQDFTMAHENSWIWHRNGLVIGMVGEFSVKCRCLHDAPPPPCIQNYYHHHKNYLSDSFEGKWPWNGSGILLSLVMALYMGNWKKPIVPPNTIIYIFHLFQILCWNKDNSSCLLPGWQLFQIIMYTGFLIHDPTLVPVKNWSL